MTERIQLIKQALTSEAMQKQAELQQEYQQASATADRLLKDLIEKESELIVVLNLVRKLELKLCLSSTKLSDNQQIKEAHLACGHEICDAMPGEERAPEVQEFLSVLSVPKNYPRENCLSGNLAKQFRKLTETCGALL